MPLVSLLLLLNNSCFMALENVPNQQPKLEKNLTKFTFSLRTNFDFADFTENSVGS